MNSNGSRAGIQKCINASIRPSWIKSGWNACESIEGFCCCALRAALGSVLVASRRLGQASCGANPKENEKSEGPVCCTGTTCCVAGCAADCRAAIVCKGTAFVVGVDDHIVTVLFLLIVFVATGAHSNATGGNET